MDIFERNRALLGEALMHELKQTHVGIIGCGGVGSAASLAVSQLGVGKITLWDFDTLSDSNGNRHIQWTKETNGTSKVMALKAFLEERFEMEIETVEELFTEDSTLPKCDILVDAIDQVTNKLVLIRKAQEEGIPFISSLGMANRTDPSKVLVTKLAKTNTDPLAKVLRYEARKRGLKDFPVVFSTEIPTPVVVKEELGRHIPASISLVPNAAGLCIAHFVLQTIHERIQNEHSRCK
ncbi:tRNA threonylcarbamoyladenosine dehydratase [Guggenheimella bovis]